MRNRSRTSNLAPGKGKCHQDSHTEVRSIQPGIADEENLWPRQAKKLGSEPRYRFDGCFCHNFWRMDDSGGDKYGSRRPFTDFHHFIMQLDEIEAGRDSNHSVFRNWHLLNGLLRVTSRGLPPSILIFVWSIAKSDNTPSNTPMTILCQTVQNISSAESTANLCSEWSRLHSYWRI